MMTDKDELNKQLQIEHELINRKLTWLLSSQSILFAALAFVVGKDVPQAHHDLFFNIVPMLGMSISLLILIGVLMAVAAKVVCWKDYNRISHSVERQPFGVRNWITFLALMPDIFMPIAFIVSWWWIWRSLA